MSLNTRSKKSTSIPEIMPVLSRGKHRTAKRGACFMEYASWMAGESWSDHPACTHPSIASLARMVNDCTSDEARSELVSLIPSVIGLLGDGERTSLRVAIRAASEALPVVSESRQRALAAGLLRCEERLEAVDALGSTTSLVQSRTALASTPAACEWASEFLDASGPMHPHSVPLMIDAVIRTAVVGMAEACVNDSDARLAELLGLVIADAVQATAAREATTTFRVSATRRTAHVDA